MQTAPSKWGEDQPYWIYGKAEEDEDQGYPPGPHSEGGGQGQEGQSQDRGQTDKWLHNL